MDLCLRGSQINLVARQKPKPKYCSQTSLNTAGGSAINQGRPRSAPFYQKRTRSSPFLYRPQSADPKFERNSSCNASWQADGGIKYNRNNKRLQSVSSSSLLKLLLEEPIKRSWLCRSGNSPDEQSDLSSLTSKKSSSFTNLRSESAGGSSVEGEYQARFGITPRKQTGRSSSLTSKISPGSSMASLNKDKLVKPSSSDYWSSHSSHNSSDVTSMYTSTFLSKTTKPDLPGRVSFSKPQSSHHDLDSSDCDNDKQQEPTISYTSSYIGSKTSHEDSISAPGPVKLSFQHFSLKGETSDPTSYITPNISTTALTSKKSVHFGGSGDEEILAETYEYPKCPSENCSCSTRSSSTASIHDAQDENHEEKCACDSVSCKFLAETEIRGGLEELSKAAVKSPKSPDIISNRRSSLDDISPVIREYKNTVGPELENSVVKTLLEDNTPKSPPSLNNLPSYIDRYNTSTPTASPSEQKQNNLSETKTGLASSSFKPNAKRNLFGQSGNYGGCLGPDNNLGSSKASYTSSSESVINNYLKVTGGTTSMLNKKTEPKENSPERILTEKAPTKKLKGKNGAKSTCSAGTSRVSKTSSNISSSSGSSTVSAKKMFKAKSFHNLREDSNLDNFNLDKVDSWMSMHEKSTSDRKPQLAKHQSIDNELEKVSSEEGLLGDDGEEEQVDSTSQISSKSDENSQDDSTYDEIVSVIKEIEEDKKKDNLAEVAVSEMELKLNSTSELADSTINNSQRSEALDSPDKFKDILNYLDNVEDSCDKALLETRRSMPESNRSEIEFVVEPDIVEDVPKLADLLILPNHQLARRVVALSLRANELANGLQMSKEQILKLKVEKQKGIRSEKANTTNRLKEQKKHYENIVRRHQGFIEQLLKDKGTLCEKVAALTRRLESQNQAWEHKLDTELTKVKETALAGEKIRRERWVRENTKKIKELTVKGLEMEINRMTSKHQEEISELKRSNQQQLLEALEEARQRHEQIESSIREACAQDRESIIEKERAAIRERFERQLEEERKSFDEQRQKLLDEFSAERQRLQGELKAKEIEHQTKRQELQREKESEMEQTIFELQEKMAKQEEKYQNRINTIEKQYEADFEIWKREYENSCKLSQVEKENSIRQHYRAERDRQIDAIVGRMDAEALKNAEEFEMKLSRFKEKYEKDLEDAESLEKSLREKYTETRSKLAESDAQVRNCQAEIKQMQMELEHSKKMCNDFINERDQLRDNLRNEMQSEVAALRNERDHEIQKIHKRVQQAIEKKDATIEILQKENGSLRERCVKLEAIIRQQRKDYCIK